MSNEAYRLRGRRAIRGDTRPLKDTPREAPTDNADGASDAPTPAPNPAAES
jgi:hypothetical protein